MIDWEQKLKDNPPTTELEAITLSIEKWTEPIAANKIPDPNQMGMDACACCVYDGDECASCLFRIYAGSSCFNEGYNAAHAAMHKDNLPAFLVAAARLVSCMEKIRDEIVEGKNG